MTTVNGHPFVLLDRIKDEDGITEEERIISNSSLEVGSKSSQTVKCESFSTNFPSRNSNLVSEDLIAQNVKTENGIVVSQENALSGLIQTIVSTDLVAKIKVEAGDESNVTHNLVGYLKDRFNSQEVQKLKSESEHVNNGGNRHGKCAPFLGLKDESLDRTVPKKPQNIGKRRLSNTHYDSDRKKYLDVSVKLVDIFSLNARRLGQAHSNCGYCSCMYCRGEYRYVSDLQHLSENLQNEQDLALTESAMKSKKNGDSVGHEVQEGKNWFQRNCSSAKFKRKMRLKATLKRHNSETVFGCKQCSATFKEKQSVKAHMRVHSDERLFNCNICSKKFRWKNYLQNHIRYVHSNKKRFSCKQCSSAFKHRSTLNKHMKVHIDDRPFSCSLCPATFKWNGNLQKHMKCVHSNERPFSCVQCSATFKENCHLKEHMISHSNKKPFRCNVCSGTFKLRWYLLDHERIHNTDNPFSCDLCSAKFKRRGYLTSHLKTHSSEKPFSCEECSSSFKKKSALKIHMRVHTNERPFSCQVCSKTFSYKCALQNHMICVHSNERPFSCNVCSATFKKRGYIKTHMHRVHSGEARLSCAHCSAKFTQKNKLIQHMSSAHDMKLK